MMLAGGGYFLVGRVASKLLEGVRDQRLVFSGTAECKDSKKSTATYAVVHKMYRGWEWGLTSWFCCERCTRNPPFLRCPAAPSTATPTQP